MQLVVMPPIGYWSDRTRTRWGRRIPYLLWATPFATLFLALTPFAPGIATRLPGLHLGGVTSVVLVFGALVLGYRAFESVTNCMYFGLLTDVVPPTHMGRFLALFRMVGAAGAFILTYWLVGHVLTHSREIFVGAAALNLVGFLGLCLLVKEGDWPNAGSASPGQGWIAGVREFAAESFTHPIYLWTYAVRICLYGAQALTAFVIFFPQHELGMDLPRIGRALAWPAAAWMLLAYPIGRLLDRCGSLRILWHGLLAIVVGYVASFFLVTGDRSFFASALVTGVAFWVVMLAQLKLTQDIFRPERYSQLAGANTIVQSIVIAAVLSPAAGGVLDALKGWHWQLALPLAGAVAIGRYRLIFLMLGVLYGLAWVALLQVRRHWLRRGGPDHYRAPI